MVTRSQASALALTQGHIAVYARNGRWRRTMARSLGEAGHSHQEAASPEEMRRVLLSQRFDVMAIKVRDEQDALEVAEALEGVALPPHGILVGSAGARLLTLRPRREGTLRYVPGSLPASEISRLVEVSISAGTWEDGAAERGALSQIEEVDLEEAIESAASAVYAQAKRRRLRFSTVVERPPERALADPIKLQRMLVALLKLIVTLAPRGALVSVEARATKEEWTVRIAASASDGHVRGIAQLAEALREETRALAALSRDVHVQGGLLWVELMGPVAPAICLTLPLPTETKASVSP